MAFIMKPYVLYSTIAVLSLTTGYFLFTDSASFPRADRSCTDRYPLIDPSFSCDEYSESSAILRDLQTTLSESVKRYESTGDAARVSIWIRDLSTLQWLGVNEKEQYAPASLFKVPIMVAIFKYAEIQPGLLSQEIVFDPASFPVQSDLVDASLRMQPGKSYTVEDLVVRMIQNSDNEAFTMLTQRLSTEYLSEVYSDLGITLGKNEGMNDELVTARSYANIFRILYQSSYLTPEYSQKALDILSKTSFAGGSRTTIPESVKISHKFGSRVEKEGSVVSYKLHDCGIVYAPNHPYLFCIMTDGRDQRLLNQIIATISGTVFESFTQTPRAD